MRMPFRFRRGAAGQQYAIVVGLIAVLALAGVVQVGSSVSSLLVKAGNSISAVGNNTASGGGGGSAAPGTIFPFAYTGGTQSFTVPASGTYQLEVWGAQGGTARHLDNSLVATGGLGGYSIGSLSLSAGETLTVMVGGQGSEFNSSNNAANQGAAGGFNGGGRSGCPNSQCNTWGTANHKSIPAGGGGASDIRRGGTALSDRIIVAGGGGAGTREGNDSSTETDRIGGSGGGINGNAGAGAGVNGTGATQSAAGVNGATAAGLGIGGDGNINDAGGGGGGYYGGGGGGNNGSGGGGSGYIGSLAGASMTAGQRAGDGQAKITYIGP